MDDRPRKSGDGDRSFDNVNGLSIGDYFNSKAKPIEASWFKKEDWFNFQETCKLMECSYHTLKRWIHDGKVHAVFPPNTEGEGNWYIHADSVANRPE